MTALHSSIWTAADPARSWRAPEPDASPVHFHRGLSGYRPTPLVEATDLAAELAVGRVLVKDESNRFGLPAFKILGASWAIERALSGGAGGVTVLVAATDGNHGRAVAQVAAQRGLAARIFLPAGDHPAAVAAIAGEGTTVTTVEASYDTAVAAATADVERNGGLLVQDTAWPGYAASPTVMTGLNCGTASAAAWPYLRHGLDAAVAVSDSEALDAAAALAAAGVPSGPCGAATLAAARRALGDRGIREHLGITATSTVVLLSTESRAANPQMETP